MLVLHDLRSFGGESERRKDCAALGAWPEHQDAGLKRKARVDGNHLSSLIVQDGVAAAVGLRIGKCAAGRPIAGARTLVGCGGYVGLGRRMKSEGDLTWNEPRSLLNDVLADRHEWQRPGPAEGDLIRTILPAHHRVTHAFLHRICEGVIKPHAAGHLKGGYKDAEQRNRHQGKLDGRVAAPLILSSHANSPRMDRFSFAISDPPRKKAAARLESG